MDIIRLAVLSAEGTVALVGPKNPIPVTSDPSLKALVAELLERVVALEANCPANVAKEQAKPAAKASKTASK